MTFYLIPSSNSLKQIWHNAYKSAQELYKSGGCIVELKPYKKNKTRQQEKYWHSCLHIIAREVGEDMESLKVEMKIRCGYKVIKRINDEMVTIPLSSTKLKIDEYSNLIEASTALAESLGIELPEPSFYGME